MDLNGNQVYRDLEEENKKFTWESYLQGNFDANNYQYYENFHHFVYDDNGCDYERYGCKIEKGDTVLDLGANIGVFAHRAEERGAAKVFSFEPVTITYDCLKKNIGSRTKAFKLGVGADSCCMNFKIHTDFRHIGGGTFDPHNTLKDLNIVYEEDCILIDINTAFDMLGHIDFMKIDIEGAEVGVLNAMRDEYLSSLRCLAVEFHSYEGFDEFQNNFVSRMNNLGFTQFVLYHGNSGLRTGNFWKI